MKSTLKAQKNISIFNFFRGIISQKWSKVQREYCRINKLKFRLTWSTHLISALLKHTHTMWTSHCRTVHLSHTGTYEEMYRNNAFTYLSSLCSDPSQLSYCHCFLLRCNCQFFFNALFATVQMWVSRTKSAVPYAKEKNSQLGRDIRNWILIRPQDPGRSLWGAQIPRCCRLFRLHL